MKAQYREYTPAQNFVIQIMIEGNRLRRSSRGRRERWSLSGGELINPRTAAILIERGWIAKWRSNPDVYAVTRRGEVNHMRSIKSARDLGERRRLEAEARAAARRL